MPGRYGSVDVKIQFDDGPGGTLVDITNYVRELGGLKIENLTQETHAFGDAWEEHTNTGMRRAGELTIGGIWDTSAGGPHIVFEPKAGDATPSAVPRTLEVTYGDGKKCTMETRIKSYEVLAKNAALTEYAAVVQPTGAAVWT